MTVVALHKKGRQKITTNSKKKSQRKKRDDIIQVLFWADKKQLAEFDKIVSDIGANRSVLFRLLMINFIKNKTIEGISL